MCVIKSVFICEICTGAMYGRKRYDGIERNGINYGNMEFLERINDNKGQGIGTRHFIQERNDNLPRKK